MLAAENSMKQPNNHRHAAPQTALKTVLEDERGLLLRTHKAQIRNKVPASNGGVECPVARLLNTAPMEVATTIMARTMAYYINVTQLRENSMIYFPETMFTETARHILIEYSVILLILFVISIYVGIKRQLGLPSRKVITAILQVLHHSQFW